MEDNSSSQNNMPDADNQNRRLVSGTQQKQSANTQIVSEHHENHIPEKWHDLGLQDRCMILLTLGILLIAGVTAYILSGQFREMSNQTRILATQIQGDFASASIRAVQVQKQLTIAQQQVAAAQNSVIAIQRQTRTAERAWIGITFPPSMGVFEGKPAEMPVQFTNSGRTAARSVRAEVVIELVPNRPDGLIFNYELPHALVTTGIALPSSPPISLTGRTYEQKVSAQITAVVHNVTHNEYEDFTRGGSYFAIYARVQYRDIFGVSHWSRSCYFVAKVDAYAQKCTNYADVDRN